MSKLILPKGLSTMLGEDGRNPHDTSPHTEAEAWHDLKVRSMIDVAIAKLRQVCLFMPSVFLADITHARPHFEFELPPVDDVRHGLFFFTLDGELGGKRFDRAMIDAMPLMVSGANDKEAAVTAHNIVNDTIRLAREMKDSAVESQNRHGLEIAGETRPTLQ